MYKEPTIIHAWIIHINQSPDLRSIPQFLAICLHATVCTSVQAYPELYHHKGDIKVLWRIGYIKLMSVSITTTRQNQEYVVGSAWSFENLLNANQPSCPLHQILGMQSNLFWTHGVFLVSILRATATHTPLKYRRPINIQNQIRPAHL